jgi:hypothetical protein
MVMPCTFNEFRFAFNHSDDFQQFPRIQSIAVLHSNLRQNPDFRVSAVPTYMDMDRFSRIALVRVEEHLVSGFPEDDRHAASLPEHFKKERHFW